MSDTLGDRMKKYELAEAGRHFMPLLPIMARIDGRRFSGFTQGMARPYDPQMTAAMVETTVDLVEETNACMGYTQSDEITLAWHSTDPKSQLWFNGRIAKIVSQLAAQATLQFYLHISRRLSVYASRRPTFDARAWQVPNRAEAANVFVWREWDATKNSITMAAGEVYSHQELHGKTGNERQEMLFQKGINWNDYPTSFKRGTYVQRRQVLKPFTATEIERLPPKHAARTNPDLIIERSEVAVLDLPPITAVTNREAVIFDGATPECGDVGGR